MMKGRLEVGPMPSHVAPGKSIWWRRAFFSLRTERGSIIPGVPSLAPRHRSHLQAQVAINDTNRFGICSRVIRLPNYPGIVHRLEQRMKTNILFPHVACIPLPEEL